MGDDTSMPRAWQQSRVATIFQVNKCQNGMLVAIGQCKVQTCAARREEQRVIVVVVSKLSIRIKIELRS